MKIKYKYSFEIYKILINKWIEREIRKPAIQERNNPQFYREHLEKFSSNLAVDLYEQREKRDGYIISKDELSKLLSKSTLNLNLFTLEDHTSRSLLNRNSDGGLKFAHKSILEYLLSERLFSNLDFLKKFNFYGMDATQSFLNEMIHSSLLSVDGIFTINNDTKSRLISSLNIREINSLHTLIIRNFDITNPRYYAGIRNCKEVYFIDDKYIFIYYVYLILNISKLIKENGTNDSNKNVFKSIKDKLDIFTEKISNKDRVVKKDYLLKIINQSNISENIKNEFKHYLVDCQGKILNNDDIQRLYHVFDLINSPNENNNQKATLDNLLGNRGTLPKKFGRINLDEIRMPTLNALSKLETIEKLAEINPNTIYYF
ncbi:MAG: hypothetical protein JNM51_01785 [Bacteroidia bacterium]|nr:hypothetical protein [Bacteroidia bacterium]